MPIEIGNLSTLTNLDLSENSLIGTLPTELGELSALDVLDVSSNLFTGTVPTELGQIETFLASGNAFEGNSTVGVAKTFCRACV